MEAVLTNSYKKNVTLCRRRRRFFRITDPEGNLVKAASELCVLGILSRLLLILTVSAQNLERFLFFFFQCCYFLAMDGRGVRREQQTGVTY